MFEHFGLRDVIACALKFKTLFLIVMVLSILFGGYVQYKQTKPSTGDPNDGTYTSTAFFTVDDKNYDTSSGLITDNGKETEIKRFASTYQALLKTDLSNQYVYDKVLSDMSKKEFLSKSKIDATENSFVPTDLGKIVTIKATDNTAEFSVAITTKNKETSEELLKYYSEYLSKTIQPQIKADSLTNVGSTTQKAASSSTKSSKPLILAVGGGFILYLLFIFTWVLFLPTINRKSDFAEYDVNVIAEL